MKPRHFFFIVGLLLANVAQAQPAERPIKIMVAPNHADWHYKVGENVKFTISVFQNGNLLKNSSVRYEIGPEKMTPTKRDSVLLATGTTTVEGGSLKTAGFLRCVAVVKVNGKEYRGLATAGFEPEKIVPAVENPADFVAFWAQAKADLAKIPIDARLTLLPERCTETVNVYHLNLQNFREGVRLYGILCVPKKEGKYPALLKMPGAGVRPYYGDVKMAEKGIITLEIGIHGIPVTMDQQVYNDLGAGALSAYHTNNLDNRDRYYYKRVYLGCVRANDFLVNMPQFDGKNLAVTGGSQGGALAITTAALDPRVKWLGAYYPALADMAGYLQNRAGGWPHIFDKNNPHHHTPEKIKTASYYDVVNFARLLQVPGYYSMGFNDEVCPPTSMYAAFNVITAPKTADLFLETGHWTYPEEVEKMNNWLVQQLKGM
ncbi:MAG: acetylxylan esterase [Runella slithyformis]|nr:MAG: acetylxylan esterase [Runella slithyformis]TAF24339.1 MAG: acetylxylan esterase [Runella slithyformis]TAF43476.1 MAG: acetylxylan esterase [Runella slithyformis]TAF81229.1 MAG: acetylxylan esterase [Runella slithyformis]